LRPGLGDRAARARCLRCNAGLVKRMRCRSNANIVLAQPIIAVMYGKMIGLSEIRDLVMNEIIFGKCFRH